MKTKQEWAAAAKTFLKRKLFHNWAVKLIALLFAVLCWGIMLLEVKPIKVKTFTNVPVTVDGDADLHARNLVVRGNIQELLGDVTVKVNTPVTSMQDLSITNITASVSVRSINAPGMATLTINATLPSRLGTINSQDVSPSTIEVEIDTLMSKTVPVEANYVGTLPDGYWADRAELSATTVDIRGPKQDIQRVTKAVCNIVQTNRTQSINDAIAVVLVDEDGDEIDSSLLLDEVPTVMVSMPVLAKKTVPVDVEGALRGRDNLPVNYELISATATPATMDIVGDAATLAAIDSIALNGLDISGKTESVHDRVEFIVPEGVRVLGGNDSGEVEVFVDIREKTAQKSFQDIPIEIQGLGKGYTATLNVETTDIDADGRISLVEGLERTDARAFIDLTGLKEGIYTVPVSVLLENEDTTLELTYVQSVAQVTVTVAKE